jgi:hypothetical protein
MRVGDRDVPVGAVVAARKAAQANDGPSALEHLRKAGRRALEVAQKIGVDVAVMAMKKAMGG